MPFTLVRNYAFTARHWLPSVPAGHWSGSMHEHPFTTSLVVTGEPDPVVGWVMDYDEIDAAFSPVLDTLRGAVLNDIEGLENPTSEHLARWIYRRMKPELPGLKEVRISEARDDCTIYSE